ncbi:hypothetical protein [Schaalia suimastitidis]|uniref:hypothetical protein n=1 Tax=Schaalia suimastitidis TaxID=121163 RepID=UPI00103B57B6|nr:hypothetical protein [Schaalia suimastitidis]
MSKKHLHTAALVATITLLALGFIPQATAATPACNDANECAPQTSLKAHAHNDQLYTEALRSGQYTTRSAWGPLFGSPSDAPGEVLVVRHVGQDVTFMAPVSDPDCGVWYIGDNGTQVYCAPPPQGTPTPTPTPSTHDLLYAALASVTINGAGLVMQPAQYAYIDFAQLAHATTPTQTHTVTLMGTPVTITLHATNFTFDFGDGTPPITSSTPGAPYPDMTISHHYTHTHPARVLTLTTTWAAHIVNPFTGEEIQVDGALSTTERTQPFPVRKAHVALTDTAEELAGH